MKQNRRNGQDYSFENSCLLRISLWKKTSIGRENLWSVNSDLSKEKRIQTLFIIDTMSSSESMSSVTNFIRNETIQCLSVVAPTSPENGSRSLLTRAVFRYQEKPSVPNTLVMLIYTILNLESMKGLYDLLWFTWLTNSFLLSLNPIWLRFFKKERGRNQVPSPWAEGGMWQRMPITNGSLQRMH